MLLDMSGANAAGMVTVQYEVPSRGMNGVKNKLLSATKGRAARRNGPLRPLESTAPCARLVAPRARAAATPPAAPPEPLAGSPWLLELASGRPKRALFNLQGSR